MLYHVFYREVSTLVFDIILLQCKYKENIRGIKRNVTNGIIAENNYSC